jgi:hypothetical protein
MKTKEKEKLYCPKNQGSFRMMFGFATPYMYANRGKSSGVKEMSVNLKSHLIEYKYRIK